MPPSVPPLPDRFEVLEALPETPFEQCFRARDRVLQREVLLKLPARAAYEGWSAPTRERLLREARALARIRHENIAPIHWVEDTPAGPLLVLDLPQGESLAERLGHGALDVPETIALGVQLGDALAHVHEQGIVHRAVGPNSVRLLANGRAQLGSFTFAKEFVGGPRGTSLVHARDAAAVAVRSQHLPEYSAPEQIAGQSADPRADVWALGCTLFRCLAGRDAFPPDGDATAPPSLHAVRKGVDKRLAEVIRKCMLFAKSARFATARDVVAALEEARQSGSRPGPTMRWRAAAAVAIAALLLGAWATRDSWAGRPELPADRGRPTEVVEVHAGYTRVYKPAYERMHGLFVAIGDGYTGTDWQKLRNPVREVDAVIAQLRANDPLWAVDGAAVALRDRQATHAAIQGELKRLVTTAGEDDGVLVYFSGHGTSKGHTFGLCAADVKGGVEGGTGYLRREELHTFLDDCRAKHVLVVLDCCHSASVMVAGTIGAKRGRPGDEGDAMPGAHHLTAYSREFLCSAAANQKAADGDTMSPFCTLLLDKLREPATAQRSYVAARFLSARIEESMDQTRATLGAMQVPKFKEMSEQQGSFLFRLGPAAGK